MVDVLVIGAGVVGGMIARELIGYTSSVVIAEAREDVALGATRANSAIVHAGFDAKEGSLKALLNVRGSKMMKKTAEELGVKYKNNGSLVVGFSDEDRSTLEELKIRGERNGVPGLKLLTRDELVKIEPNIGETVSCALHAPTGAIICPYELCMAAVGCAMDNGAELRLNFKVAKIEKSEKGYIVTAENGETVEAKYVINAAGAYSDEIARLAGDESFSVHPRRGQYMLLDRDSGDLVSHTVFRCPSKMGKGILVSPTVDGNLLLGPTAEDIDDKTDTKTTADSLAKIKASALEQVKGINFGKVITSFSGLRSVGSTGDFIINSPFEGFINVAGIESPGLSAAPAIAEYVRDMLISMGAPLAKRDDYNPTRRPAHWFSELSVEEKNNLIAEKPEYAKIVCRCELVTEGEIRDAIRTNPPARDIDGVKRRTRATMGRCQGGFCTPYIVEILAEELGIDYTRVTKFGGESYINISRTKEV
ncbi:MAG: NAD(P)/FAD-dependent oxidoreductase [Clostridia bacterium]|nr:NAD(P)/FAD-dependent oxidoreductase [Clostridia bacterium]